MLVDPALIAAEQMVVQIALTRGYVTQRQVASAIERRDSAQAAGQRTQLLTTKRRGGFYASMKPYGKKY